MSAKEIIKAIKIKLILNKLSKAKEAAMREFLGLPPKQSWTSECTSTIMTCVKDQCLHIFCPCCTYHRDRRQKRLACLSSPTFKEFVGFMSGLAMTFLVFLILVFQMDVHPKKAFIGCAVGSTILSLLMAFSLNIRCLVILMLPQFFSGKGRMFLLMYALFLVMNHPVKNAFVNVTVMSQSATCGQELALNETKELIRAATAPLEGMMKSIKRVVKKLVDFSNALRDTYMALSRTIREIGSTISTAAQWLMNISERCKTTMASPYRQCKEAFREGIRKCRSKLGVLKGVCKAGSAFDFLCHVAKVGQAFCFVVDIFKRFIVQPVDTVPPHTKLHVVGTGPMADMYKSMVTMFEPIAMSHVKIDVTPCVPNPSEPDWNVYRTIGVIYLVCLIMTIGEAYALRLRHMIMGCYFPRRERKRAIWLYNHIMKTRGGLMASARKSIRERQQGSAMTEHISLKGRLAAMFPILEKIFKFFGWEVKSCLYCGREGKPDDYMRFIHCHYFDCDAIYCIDCYADLDNICAVCNNAVDIGGSGESEEIDSSVSERDRLRAAVQRKMRNEKIAALQAERTTSRVMTRFKSTFGGPSISNKSLNNSASLNPDEASQSSERDSDEEIPERQSLLRRPRNANRSNSNRSNVRRNVPIYQGYDPIGRTQPRDAFGLYDNYQSTSDYVVNSDFESTCSSSCDSDDLDFSYQYETRCYDLVSEQNDDGRDILLPRHGRGYDFVSYDIYSSSESDQNGKSADDNEDMTEPVSLVIGRT